MTMRERAPAQPPDSVDLTATLELLASLTQYAEAGAVQPHTLAQAVQNALEEHGEQIEVLVAVAKLYLAIGDRAEAGLVLGRAGRVAPGDARVAQLLTDAGFDGGRSGPMSARPRSVVQPALEARPAPVEIDTRVRRREPGPVVNEVAPPSSRTPVSIRAPHAARPARAVTVTVQDDSQKPRPKETTPPATPRSGEGPLLRPTVRMNRVASAPDRGRWNRGEGREPFDSRPDRDPASEGPRSAAARAPGPGSSSPHLAKMARDAATAGPKTGRAATGNLKLLDPNDERRRLDRYELIGEIASGGMASVFLARLAGVAGFQRFFAIKRLHPHLADDQEFIDMFLDEARLAAGIHHPSVVPILEVGTTEAGYYLVMDYIEGDTLSGVMNRAATSGGLPRPIALRILVDALLGLHAAHDLTDPDGNPVDLVHRDCSPQNILVGIDGTSRITDFGVARAASRITTTRSATIKGKLAYLSPEQATGRGVDRRSDLFGMGVILWEVLAGKRLFRADSDGATLSRILVEPIPSLVEVAPHVPQVLDAVVMTALARDPDARFATAADMADALDRAVREADVTGLYVGSPREVASYMRDLFGADIQARRDAVRSWLAQCADPPASSGFRPQLLAPPSSASPSARDAGNAPPSQRPTASPPTAVKSLRAPRPSPRPSTPKRSRSARPRPRRPPRATRSSSPRRPPTPRLRPPPPPPTRPRRPPPTRPPIRRRPPSPPPRRSPSPSRSRRRSPSS